MTVKAIASFLFALALLLGGAAGAFDSDTNPPEPPSTP